MSRMLSVLNVLVAATLLSAGCELIASVDRSKIAGGNGTCYGCFNDTYNTKDENGKCPDGSYPEQPTVETCQQKLVPDGWSRCSERQPAGRIDSLAGSSAIVDPSYNAALLLSFPQDTLDSPQQLVLARQTATGQALVATVATSKFLAEQRVEVTQTPGTTARYFLTTRAGECLAWADVTVGGAK